MTKIAVDCRMIGSGGIGSYIQGVLPFLLENTSCLLIGSEEQCSPYLSNSNAEFCFCAVKPFSIQELLHFPVSCLKKINHCTVFYSPYCNIPGGITIPVFTTIHDIVFLDVPGLASRFGTAVRTIFYNRAVRRSETVFTVSEFSKQRILEKLQCRCPLVVTYNAAPAYLQTPFSVRPKKTNTILFVGNIKKHKGLHTLLDAVDKAASKGFRHQLVIVGNAENFRTGDEETVERLRHEPAERIRFTGRISDDELKTLYAEASLLIQPSAYEGFGMPPLEALTVGTPVILSDIPVFREIYRDFPITWFKNGNADDLAQKIIDRCSNPDVFVPIPSRYSFKNTSRIILDTLKHDLNTPFSV